MKCDRTCCRGRIGSADGFTDRAFVGYADRAARASRPEASIPLRGFSATRCLHHIATGSVILFFMALAALFGGL